MRAYFSFLSADDVIVPPQISARLYSQRTFKRRGPQRQGMCDKLNVNIDVAEPW